MLYKVTLFLLIFGSIASEAEDNQDLKNDILFLKIQELEAEIAAVSYTHLTLPTGLPV